MFYLFSALKTKRQKKTPNKHQKTQAKKNPTKKQNQKNTGNTEIP